MNGKALLPGDRNGTNHIKLKWVKFAECAATGDVLEKYITKNTVLTFGKFCKEYVNHQFTVYFLLRAPRGGGLSFRCTPEGWEQGRRPPTLGGHIKTARSV